MADADLARLHHEATALRERGRNAAAIAAYRRLLAAESNLPDSWYNLGLVLKAEGCFEEALDAYGEALGRGVEAPQEVRLNRAVILADHLRREDEAEEELRVALEVDPEYAPARLNFGNLREERGDLEGAAAAYEAMLPAEDGSVAQYQELRLEALARLVQLRPPRTLDDPLLRRLENAAREPRLVGLETRANLNYAFGRALDALGEYDRAFAAFVEANACVRRAGPPYDRQRIVREVDRLVEVFATPGKRPAAPTADPEPVFICGMFRSGSTLVEQALAAHPMVVPGGELNLLNRLASRELHPYPQSMASLADDRAGRLADDYRRELVKRFPESAGPGRRVTDKLPDNFLRIGLIKRLFPSAKIVHTVRDPVDTCLSVFFQHIDQRIVGYASDLADCGHYYGQYRRMMAHWKAHYGADIFDFDYDRFVAEPKPLMRSLLDFLGLDWDDGCLEFQGLKNPVKTASYWQVRQPLYRDSSGRRRHYRKHLEPLRAALRDAGIDAD